MLSWPLLYFFLMKRMCKAEGISSSKEYTLDLPNAQTTSHVIDTAYRLIENFEYEDTNCNSQAMDAICSDESENFILEMKITMTNGSGELSLTYNANKAKVLFDIDDEDDDDDADDTEGNNINDESNNANGKSDKKFGENKFIFRRCHDRRQGFTSYASSQNNTDDSVGMANIAGLLFLGFICGGCVASFVFCLMIRRNRRMLHKMQAKLIDYKSRNVTSKNDPVHNTTGNNLNNCVKVGDKIEQKEEEHLYRTLEPLCGTDENGFTEKGDGVDGKTPCFVTRTSIHQEEEKTAEPDDDGDKIDSMKDTESRGSNTGDTQQSRSFGEVSTDDIRGIELYHM